MTGMSTLRKAVVGSGALAAAAVAASFALKAYQQQNRNNARRGARSAAEAIDQAASDAAAAAAAAEKEKKPKSNKVAVDMAFLRRLWSLLKVLIPSLVSAEFGYVVLTMAMMVARTYCDLWMIANSTAVEAAIISRSFERFKQALGKFAMAMVPIACVTASMKYALNELSLRFRTRMTEHLYKDYLKGYTYYKINNLDNRIQNPDQLLTQDVERFCQSCTDLLQNVSKPLLDIVIYSKKLSGTIGGQGPAYMLLYLAFSGVILTRLRRPTGRFTVQEQQLEGDFRFVNSRLIAHSEEIAFYNGNFREKNVLDRSFNRLVKLLRRSINFRFGMSVIDSVIAKYIATVVGFTVVSRPFLDLKHPRHLTSTHGEIMEDYYKSGRMLVNMAGAVGRLVLAGRELTRLAGFTQRVAELIDVLADLNQGRYQRTMVTGNEQSRSSRVLVPNTGKIVYEDHIIRFEDVPLVTPNGDVLVESLSIEVRSGCNVLIAGPNGCGKSSLFRILGELWPMFGGTLIKPSKSKLFYVPQKPYMTLGTLRDQIIYPDIAERCHVSDDELRQYLDQVHLGYLCDRENGLDAVQDWLDVLSGGEKQRVAMARLFYHKPQFAILDECTSAVSVDVEGFMYEHCRQLNITLFTVSHRKSLWKHHEKVLQFDGRGAYQYREIKAGAENDEFGS